MVKVIISGGGTGGHVFPAIAIANAIKKADPAADILFIGANGKMEMERVPAAGYKIEGLTISGIQRRLTYKNLLVPYRVLNSMLKARSIISKFKPGVVIGVGGYASGPTLRMASMKNIPTIIQEQNSYPGITNKILGSKANKICVAYEGMERFFPADKIIMTGNPVRQEIEIKPEKRSEALKYFGLSEGKKTVLVTGGSLGAATLNKSIRNFIDTYKNDDVQVLWQTGRYYFSAISSDTDLKKKENVKINAFLDKMDLAYTVADVVISRAGAIAISELCLVGKPVILIPSPNVTEDHQTKNAMALVKKDAAILIKDAEAVEKLPSALDDLLHDGAKQEILHKNILSLGIPDAADRIAAEALKLAGKK